MTLMSEAEKQILRNQEAIMKALIAIKDIGILYAPRQRLAHHIDVTNELLR